MAAGGKGANQAVAAARAGGNVVFIARVGDDLFGRQAIDGFLRDGINVRYVFKDTTSPSGIALIMVGENGQNSIAVASGANANLSVADLEVARSVLSGADILLIQLEVPLVSVRTAITIAAESGIRVILNPAPGQHLENEILKRVSILTPNETETEILTGKRIDDESSVAGAAEDLLSRGVETVLITLGARGVYVAASGVRCLVPAYHVRPVDTTAAGDVFNGALAVALAERHSLLDAVRFASAAGALSVTKLGAQPSAPFRKDVEDFLRQHGDPC